MRHVDVALTRRPVLHGVDAADPDDDDDDDDDDDGGDGDGWLTLTAAADDPADERMAKYSANLSFISRITFSLWCNRAICLR